MDLTAVLVQLIAGAVGGNAAGLVNKTKSLGPMLNTILGALGGLAGGHVASQGMDAGTGAQVGLSAVVGAVLPLVVGMLKKKA
jgi:uncharacterized membrane protein YeaQ/YmgE (transglycosylase-associated protein family)